MFSASLGEGRASGGSSEGAIAARRELLLLVGRNEIGERACCGHLRQLRETPRIVIGGGEIARDDIRRIGAGCRILSELEIGRDRCGFPVLQMQRVEVEPQMRKQRRGQRNDTERAAQDNETALPQETVDGRQRAESHFDRLARRIENPEQRRQERNAGEKGDDHAGAGDAAELGETAIVGG
jgi:hypothetical protein